MGNIWEEFDANVDLTGIRDDIRNAEENGGDGTYEKVPHGIYEVKITKLELAKSKSGNPMMSCWMKIVDGDKQNKMLFMHQVVKEGFQIHLANNFLRKLVSEMDEPLPIEFKSYKQYDELILDVAEAIDNKFEYRVRYYDKKGYDSYEIEEVYVLED